LAGREELMELKFDELEGSRIRSLVVRERYNLRRRR